jgi:hypothetical protein
MGWEDGNLKILGAVMTARECPPAWRTSGPRGSKSICSEKETNMKRLMLPLVLLLLVSCTAGPVFVAKTENEGVRTSYRDPKLDELASQNRAALTAIYQRYELANVDVYPNGIGFTALTDDKGKTHYYLLVDVRPRDISFGQDETTPKERFNEVFQHHLEKNLRLVKEEDLGMNGVEGLAFAVHWPVRNLSWCDSHGGFLEYTMIHIPKADFVNLARGNESFSKATADAEIIACLNMKEPSLVHLSEIQ